MQASLGFHAGRPKGGVSRRRNGAPPIELVNGERLIDLFEQLRLGLIERKTYEVDQKFFEEFRA